jgi:hypothetical protein
MVYMHPQITGELTRMRTKERIEAATATRLARAANPVPGWLLFRRIVDVPFDTCLAALQSRQRSAQDGELRIGKSLLRGPIEHDRDWGTCRIRVRLARGPLRPLLPMRLGIDRWSSSSTAVELIPCRRVRPTAAYFRAGHFLLDCLARALAQHSLPPSLATPGIKTARGEHGPKRPRHHRCKP